MIGPHAKDKARASIFAVSKLRTHVNDTSAQDDIPFLGKYMNTGLCSQFLEVLQDNGQVREDSREQELRQHLRTTLLGRIQAVQKSSEGVPGAFEKAFRYLHNCLSSCRLERGIDFLAHQALAASTIADATYESGEVKYDRPLSDKPWSKTRTRIVSPTTTKSVRKPSRGIALVAQHHRYRTKKHERCQERPWLYRGQQRPRNVTLAVSVIAERLQAASNKTTTMRLGEIYALNLRPPCAWSHAFRRHSSSQRR